MTAIARHFRKGLGTRLAWGGLMLALLGLQGPAASILYADEPDVPAPSKVVQYDRSAFRPDPSYADTPYDADKQLEIYGGKHANPTARPMLELGRELYREGPFRPAKAWVGKKNLLFPHIQAYGDYRIAVAYNDNGNKEQWTLANRLNLDIDVKLTATERFHAFMRPLDKNNSFTRFDFGGDKDEEFEIQLDGNTDALFFEGEVGPMLAGATNRDNKIDLPFAIGLMPLLLQNGVWVEDAFTGAAFTIPARNSPLFDISNMDTTFFVGTDRVSSKAVVKADGNLADRNAHLFGVTSFIEANQGYWEVGYGFTDTEDEDNQTLDDLGYHNLTASFTRRYGGWISNSVRAIWNFGQNRDLNAAQTADGWLFLIENSLITSKPLTLVPYLNMFFGLDTPQSLARDAGAGGVLKNTGINFETDGLTGFPKLDDDAKDTWGGALGIEYLFNLDQQIVLEAAVVKDLGESNNKGDELGLGVRYQLPLTNAWLLRADVMVGFRASNQDLFGARLELRRKF